jgi:hypothetical protein
MSVAILKADDEVGYWEYSVLTTDGEWTLEFARGEELLSSLLGTELPPVVGLNLRDEEVDESRILTVDDCVILSPHANKTHRVYRELWDHGMATTSPEWRIDSFGSATPDQAEWVCDHDEHQ